MTLREACLYGQEKLARAGVAEAALDAFCLLEYVSGCTRNEYYSHPERELTQEQTAAYENVVRRRGERFPLQHITGEQAFMGLTFQVNAHVLIPRQDTEILVEEALKVLKPGMRVLDMCTGSGCILLSLMYYCKGLQGTGADISAEALKQAARNRDRLAPEAELLQSDLFERVEGSFDMIISNPPYIRSSEIAELTEEVRDHDPLLALDGHEDGLYFYRRLAAESGKHLKAGGRLYVEIGYDQGAAVSQLFAERGFCEIEVKKDLAGLDRVVKGRIPA